jgi:phosphate-selective porin O/P
VIDGFARARAAAVAAAACLLLAAPANAQVTPAAGYTPPDDTPSIRVGATLFADYTIQERPKVEDADGNDVTANSFNVARAYINITGNITHRIAFRITPDITRESGVGSSLNGSLTYRLKYAYAQFNLDDWMTRGSWVRLGQQQTPWVDFMETLYRYRFQGTVFEDREAFLSSSDFGASFHYNLPNNYGDIHGGVYNGETYTRPDPNDQKGFQVRGTFRPLPMNAVLRGLRLTGFWDQDAYVKDGERQRGIVAVTFEHPYVNASFDYLAAKDQTSVTRPTVDARGWSAWVTPRSTIGWEGLLRFDHLEPNTDAPGTRDRLIAGVAYWFPHQGNVSTALLFDVDNTESDDFRPVNPATRRLYALHLLVNF